MAVHGFKIVNQTELDAVRAHAEQARDVWLDHWMGSPGRQVGIDVVSAAGLAADWGHGSRWLVGRINGRRIGLHAGDDLDRVLLAALGSDPQPQPGGRMSERIVYQALQDLVICLLHRFGADTARIALERDGEALLQEVRRPGSGFVGVKMRLDTAEIVVAIEWELAAPGMDAPVRGSDLPSLSSASESIGESKLKLAVVVGDAELDLGALAELARGDVIRLDKSLAEPLEVWIEDRPVCRAQLGAKNGGKAVQLIR